MKNRNHQHINTNKLKEIHAILSREPSASPPRQSTTFFTQPASNSRSILTKGIDTQQLRQKVQPLRKGIIFITAG
jgi:hypothetical protein